MNTVTIYKITCTQGVMMSEQGTRFSLRPWGNNTDRIVGMVRVRHRLNRRLLDHGGHIGYYIRPSARGKGHGRDALRLALRKLRALGARKALVTVSPDNVPSTRVVLANGGRLRNIVSDPETNAMVARYWIR